MIRQQYASGRRQPSRDINLNRTTRWRAEEDAALRSLAGQYDSLTIARLLNECFSKARTEAAVNHRIKHLGILRMAVRPFSASEVGRIFGVTRETVRTRFVKTGLLVGTLRRGGPHGMRMFERAEVERFIREHPEAYDVETIRDPSLKALANAVQRGRRLLSTLKVEQLTGVGFRQLCQWYADGLVPSARRVEGVRRGRFGTWLIEAADLATVRRLKAEHDERRRRRAQACPAGHAWAKHGYVEPSSGQRRCAVCRRERAQTPPSFRLAIVNRDEAIRRVSQIETVAV